MALSYEYQYINCYAEGLRPSPDTREVNILIGELSKNNPDLTTAFTSDTPLGLIYISNDILSFRKLGTKLPNIQGFPNNPVARLISSKGDVSNHFACEIEKIFVKPTNSDKVLQQFEIKIYKGENLLYEFNTNDYLETLFNYEGINFESFMFIALYDENRRIAFVRPVFIAKNILYPELGAIYYMGNKLPNQALETIIDMGRIYNPDKRYYTYSTKEFSVTGFSNKFVIGGLDPSVLPSDSVRSILKRDGYISYSNYATCLLNYDSGDRSPSINRTDYFAYSSTYNRTMTDAMIKDDIEHFTDYFPVTLGTSMMLNIVPTERPYKPQKFAYYNGAKDVVSQDERYVDTVSNNSLSPVYDINNNSPVIKLADTLAIKNYDSSDDRLLRKLIMFNPQTNEILYNFNSWANYMRVIPYINSNYNGFMPQMFLLEHTNYYYIVAPIIVRGGTAGQGMSDHSGGWALIDYFTKDSLVGQKLNEISNVTAEDPSTNPSTAHDNSDPTYSGKGEDADGNIVDGKWVDTDGDGEPDTFIPDYETPNDGMEGNNPTGDPYQGYEAQDSTDYHPPKTGTGTGLYSVFIPTDTELENFVEELYSDDVISHLKDFFTTNPLDGIYSTFICPFGGEYQGTLTPKRIKIGTYKFENPMGMLDENSEFIHYHYGEISLAKCYGIFGLDYSPATDMVIYLPYIGYKDLDVDAMIGHKIDIWYSVCLSTGDIIAQVYLIQKDPNSGSESRTLYSQYEGNCAYRIPMSKLDSGNIIQGTLGLVAGATTIGVSATTGNPIGIASGTLGTINSVANMGKSSIETSGTISGNPSYMAHQKPYVIIKRPPEPIDPKKFAHDFGYPSYVYKTVEEIASYNTNSYNKYCDVDMRGLGTSTPATEDEIKMIKDIMEGGFYV